MGDSCSLGVPGGRTHNYFWSARTDRPARRPVGGMSYLGLAHRFGWINRREQVTPQMLIYRRAPQRVGSTPPASRQS